MKVEIVLAILFTISLVVNIAMIIRYKIFKNFKRKISYRLAPLNDISPPSASTGSKTPLMVHLVNEQVEIIPESETSDAPIIPSSLIVPPGCYKINGKCFDMFRDGLYRYMEFPGRNVQRIVFRSEIDPLISAFCWIGSHGPSDDGLTDEELSSRALHTKIFVTCGRMSSWVKGHIEKLGFTSRLVACITAEEWNGFDDGHTMLSVHRKDLGKWIVYDLDKKCYFVDPITRVPLSFIEFYRAQKDGKYEIINISSGCRVDPSSYTSFGGNDLSLLMEFSLANPRLWYKRVMQIPMIHDSESDQYYFFDQVQKRRMEAFASNYKYLPQSQFMKKFYPDHSEATSTD